MGDIGQAGAVSIKDNIARVRERIERAALRAGRDPASVGLVAVSKTKPAELIYEAYNEGLTVFGENYAQELRAKQDSELLRDLPGVAWHMIGHVQTNKVKQIVGRTALIHSLDSLRLAAEIQRQSERLRIVTDVLIEVNVAREKDKYGFHAEEVNGAAEEIAGYGNIRVLGLMTSAPITRTYEQNRPYFHELHDLYLDINRKKIHNIHMSILSMGMSGDFETAIEEGATMLRIGTGLFGSR